MSRASLQDDLLNEFKEEKKMINEQVQLLDPLATSLRKPAAQRLLGNTALILCEIICYLLAIASVAFIFFMNKIYPFYILSDVLYNSKYREEIGIVNITYLNIGIYCLIGLIALLFLIIGRTSRTIRLKNEILHMAGKDIKVIAQEHLKRKAAINVIEQRHFMELPGLRTDVDINDLPNPGYDEVQS
jgi:hypothetical protein